MRLQTIAIAAAAMLGGLTLGGAAASASDDHGRDRHHEQGDDRDHDRDHGGERGRGEEGHHRGRSLADADPAYVKECGACHLAYPPSMLPAAAWREMMGGLDRHFGQDAALDDATRARLEGWLTSRAGRGSSTSQRITQAGWFQREHREVPAGAASRPAVRSMSNCAACHQDAARWDFDEHRVTIPR